jgi:hypothetical protein
MQKKMYEKMIRVTLHYPPLLFLSKLKELSKQNAIINPKRRKVKGLPCTH